MLLRFLGKIIAFFGRIWHRISQWRPVRYILFWRDFYRMRRLGVPVMTLRMARRHGIRDIYHLNKGVGDGLMFAGVAREYYKKTGNRPLLYVPQWNIFRYCDFCWFLWDWRFQWQNMPGAKHTMDAFYILYGAQLAGHPVQLRDGYTFCLRPLEYLKGCYIWGNNFVKLFGGFPKRGQIMQWVANRMDITGDIVAKPEIRLNDYERNFGKFATGKIVIKCGGNGAYKYLLPKIAQGIVDALRGEYDFIQIGGSEDPVLNGVENMCRLNMREFAGILTHARMFVGAIGGMMHLARAVDCPSVILYGCEHDDFYYPSQCRVFSDNRCTLCAQNCWWPDKDDERRCPNRYRCIVDFDVQRIVNVIRKELQKPRESSATADVFKCVGHIVDCNSTMNWWLTLDDFITNFAWPQKSDECVIAAFSQTFDYSVVRPDADKYILTQILKKPVNIGNVMDNITHFEVIVSDNPLLIRLKPRPSYFAYIAKIADMQKKWTADWHGQDPVDDIKYWRDETMPKPEYKTLEGYARANHMMNYFLWHTEDIARRRDVPDSQIADAKRKIDKYNQMRNDFAEKMDETMIQILTPALPGAFNAPLNTESLGMILDRLSILALKIYHMKQAAKKRENRAECIKKLQVLRTQHKDLMESTRVLISDYLHGSRQPRAYYQHKMYNDPKLNPQLSGGTRNRKIFSFQ